MEATTVQEAKPSWYKAIAAFYVGILVLATVLILAKGIGGIPLMILLAMFMVIALIVLAWYYMQTKAMGYAHMVHRCIDMGDIPIRYTIIFFMICALMPPAQIFLGMPLLIMTAIQVFRRKCDKGE